MALPSHTRCLVRLLPLCLAFRLLLPIPAQGQESPPCKLRVGAERMELLLPLLEGKRVALMVNQTSLVGEAQLHLLDTLLSSGIRVSKVFAPEHGFRGDVDAGKSVRDGRDLRTGIPIVSLYGRTKKPTPEMLQGVDVLLFDIQDVGARFYTYINSMYYLMQAAQENGLEMVVCDRPNPNDYIDGPMLEADCKSFVGLLPLPILHGMTVGELAEMINGEDWLSPGDSLRCALTVVPLVGWEHGEPYELPVRPSPNLPNTRSVTLYPSLCFFEGTGMSVGRGTDKPFCVLGYPNKAYGSYSFVPRAIQGADSSPLHRGKRCYGVDLSRGEMPRRELSLGWLIHYHRLAKRLGHRLITRKRFFELIAGTKQLARQLDEGLDEAEIRASWQEGLERFKVRRRLYLLYPEQRQ